MPTCKDNSKKLILCSKKYFGFVILSLHIKNMLMALSAEKLITPTHRPPPFPQIRQREKFPINLSRTRLQYFS